ncbi:hypothetical protein BD626DRAFT_22802 [Schizophyllum amplum]|uniref:Uncharacterized protein n=1 Tax=Schizophyllum amplum TaxID=97359 RepID=A0A550CZ36_9AGAR|nr:hypothetical protein BD626DRAFT_22802 [Auriculariopsis ampla]
MSTPLRDVDAVFIAAFLSTFFFGVYLAVAYECSRILWSRRRRHRRTHLYLVCTHVVLLVLTFIRCITVLVRTLDGLRYHQEPDGNIDQGPINDQTAMVTNVCWVLAILVSDAFIIYRVSAVWRFNYLAIACPLMGWLAGIALGIFFLDTASKYGEGADPFEGQLLLSNVMFCVCTLVINLMSTVLIAGRIWWVRRKVHFLSGDARDTVNSLVTVLLESAAFYTVVLVMHIIFLATDSLLNFICIDIETPIIGIVFSFIIIRVSEGKAHGNTSDGEPPSAGTSGPRSHTRDRWASGNRSDRIDTTGTIDVAIRLETVTHRDGEDVGDDSISTRKGKPGSESW